MTFSFLNFTNPLFLYSIQLLMYLKMTCNGMCLLHGMCDEALPWGGSIEPISLNQSRSSLSLSPCRSTSSSRIMLQISLSWLPSAQIILPISNQPTTYQSLVPRKEANPIPLLPPFQQHQVKQMQCDGVLITFTVSHCIPLTSSLSHLCF